MNFHVKDGTGAEFST